MPRRKDLRARVHSALSPRPRHPCFPKPEVRAHGAGPDRRDPAGEARPTRWPLPRLRRRAGGRGGGAQWASEPASPSRSPAAVVADQRLPRVPAEPGQSRAFVRCC